MADKIYVTFVNKPDDYLTNHNANPAISHFVYHAIKEKFGDRVVSASWTDDLPLSGNDLLVTILPNQNLHKWKRSIVVTNDNFDVDKWKHGKFKKYGLDLQTDHTIFYNGQLKDTLAGFWMTNDLAIKRWNDNHTQVAEKKKWLEDNTGKVVLTQPPLDKNYLLKLYNPNQRFSDLRMLIYHGGWRKNAQQLIDLLNKNGYGHKFDVITHLNKEDPANVKRYLSKYAYLAHISVSEAFPYFASDLLCQGLLLFGHEEWWHGYGNSSLTWSYDPNKEEENMAKLKKLMSKEFVEEYHSLRNNVWSQHVNRKDNDWAHFTKMITDEISIHI